ncbi:hypothetical protein BDP27DRAFT_296566 [Rhodocollybia butyracea]|uniref:Uncharacterized protein n=1 Tax=Rhodocollybia butyracea TaxID=206335 RepID=A0A9P5PF59_9AGAR|nr:hypothetical protein BDP27DRAFT_296566 [Rhodocollybia butyracea]
MQRELSLAGIPSSVPISIQRRTKPKAPPLSLASYQPAAVLVDNMPSSSQRASGRLSSGTKLRRAAYTERDVQRGIDPGVLDFVMEEQPEDEDEDELGEERFAENGTNGRGGAVNGVEANGVNRGRDRAHKILESQAKMGFRMMGCGEV